MTIVNLKHPVAKSDDSSFDLVLAAMKALEPCDQQLREWVALLDAYRALGSQYIATQNAGVALLGVVCQLQTDLEALLGTTGAKLLHDQEAGQ